MKVFAKSVPIIHQIGTINKDILQCFMCSLDSGPENSLCVYLSSLEGGKQQQQQSQTPTTEILITKEIKHP